MIMVVPPPGTKQNIVAQTQGSSSPAVQLAVEQMVPSHLLDGGEVVLFAIKPSAWFVLLVSMRWLITAILIVFLATTKAVTPYYRVYITELAILIVGVRLGWATLDWVSRLYVLTNRRVMRIRGVWRVEMFDCMLDRIQNTHLILSPSDRLIRVGTVIIETASGSMGNGGRCAWRTVSKPLEVHEKLREAIHRNQNRGEHGL